ncbi:hypothetical protein CerSpe_215780 [Prunus speciosa]
MHNFGDEFTIESYRIPWLVWIQVMVMILLLILLFCFSILVLDLDDHSHTTTTSNNKPSSSSTSRLVSDDLPKHNTSTTAFTHRLQNTQVEESIKGEIVASTRSRIMRGEDMLEMEAPTAFHLYFHPCYYFRLARLAFLKCLGLDFASESSSTPQRGKGRES